jgi:tRNA 2-thiouridine synthesizing protein A
MNNNHSIDIELDLKGLSCPLPILKTKKTLSSLESGKKVYVICTDSGSFDDFKYFCDHSGHKLLAREKTEIDFRFLIQRK